MDICEVIMERNRHDSEKSCSTTLQYHDLEAAEALVCMSSWVQRSPKPRPLTPTSDSCDSLSLHHEILESPKDLASLSSLVSFKDQEMLLFSCFKAFAIAFRIWVGRQKCSHCENTKELKIKITELEKRSMLTDLIFSFTPVHDTTTQPQLCRDLDHICCRHHHASSGCCGPQTECPTAQNVPGTEQQCSGPQQLTCWQHSIAAKHFFTTLWATCIMQGHGHQCHTAYRRYTSRSPQSLINHSTGEARSTKKSCAAAWSQCPGYNTDWNADMQ